MEENRIIRLGALLTYANSIGLSVEQLTLSQGVSLQNKVESLIKRELEMKVDVHPNTIDGVDWFRFSL